MPRTTQALDGPDWTLRLDHVHDKSRGAPQERGDVPADLIERDVPATVPGCVHTDLLAANLIPDPYYGDNELDLLWIGRCDWSYRRTFDAAADLLRREHVELCFDGLDTIATILLNGTEIASTRNMHRRYRFDVRGALVAGKNELEVRFAAPVPAAWETQEKLGELPAVGGGANPQLPHNMLRKMACNFGWDWGPAVPTCGLWRGVSLEAWDAGRLGDVRPVVTGATAARATLEVHAEVAGQGTAHATLTAPDGKTLAADGNLITVADPELWWPKGHGKQPLYHLKVELKDAEGELLDVWTGRVGLRTTALDVTPDNPSDPQPADGLGVGARMTLRVNGEPIYCKGADWIPDDCFLPRITKERLKKRVDQSLDANMNMLRIWGGGVYESDDLYDICDETGMMVWQDFLLACAAYHEDEQTAAEIEAEARDNVARLARHPSLVLWNGCNENLWGWYDWPHKGKTWKQWMDGRGWGLKYYFETFPAAVADLAPTTPYWPGSPSSGTTPADFWNKYPNANEFGNRHVWNVWHGPGHYLNYLGHWPRFCSEFGFHGQATWPTVAGSTPPDQRYWDSPVMVQHNKNGGAGEMPNGQVKANVRMGDDFAVPEDFDTWLYLSQVMQVRALSVGVGWFRSLFPWNSGSLFWQLNDCWPCASWSAIDGAGRAKPLLHAARRFFAPRVVNLGPRLPTQVGGWEQDAGPLRAYAHNDSPDVWAGTLRVRRMNFARETLAQHARSVEIAPRSAASLDVPDDWPRDPAAFLVADLPGGERAFWWFGPDKNLPMPSPAFETEVGGEGRSVTVHAKTLLRDVCLFADRLHPDAVANDASVTLLAGESFTFAVDTPTPLDAAALVRPPVLRCVGDRVG